VEGDNEENFEQRERNKAAGGGERRKRNELGAETKKLRKGKKVNDGIEWDG